MDPDDDDQFQDGGQRMARIWEITTQVVPLLGQDG